MPFARYLDRYACWLSGWPPHTGNKWATRHDKLNIALAVVFRCCGLTHSHVAATLVLAYG